MSEISTNKKLISTRVRIIVCKITLESKASVKNWYQQKKLISTIVCIIVCKNTLESKVGVKKNLNCKNQYNRLNVKVYPL